MQTRAMPARGVLLAGVLALLSVDCTRGAPPAPVVLTAAVRADISGVFPNPPVTNDSFTLDVTSNVFEGLVSLDRELVPRPALAVRWENPDTRTWIFQLRPDARFSDGTPVTAEDVVASLDAARTQGWCNAGALQSVERVTAAGPLTVRIETRTAAPNLLGRLHYGFVLPKAAVSQTPVPAIGTGPWRIASRTPGVVTVLERNPHARAPAPALERIELHVVADAQERARRVTAGEAHVADGVPLADVDRLRAAPGVRVLLAPGLRVVYLAFKVDEPPFSDQRIREAIDLAIDRGELVRRALHGHGFPASQLVTPAVFGFDTTLAVRPPDRARARALLAEASAGALDVRLDGPRNRYVADAAILDEVARQLADVGVRAEAHALPQKEWVDRVQSGQSKLFLYGWACETRDAGDALDALMHARNAQGLGLNNFQGVADAELDRLIDAAGRAPETKERARLFAQALARVDALRLVVPLEVQPEVLAVRQELDWQPPLNYGLRLFDTSRLSAR